MSRIVQLGLGALAVVAATAFSRRGSTSSFNELSREKCVEKLKRVLAGEEPATPGCLKNPYLFSSVPEITFSRIVNEKNARMRLFNKMVTLDQMYSQVFGQYSDDLIYELSEEGYQSNFPQLTPVAESGEYDPSLDHYKRALIDRFDGRPDMERLWVQLVDRIKIAKAAYELQKSLFVDEHISDRSLDKRTPPSGWYMPFKGGKVFSYGNGKYSYIKDGKALAQGSIHDLTKYMIGFPGNGYKYFWLGELGDVFDPLNPPGPWQPERTPERDLALEDSINLFCEISPFAYSSKWWNDIDWPSDVRSRIKL